jgi:hypothetical protein
VKTSNFTSINRAVLCSWDIFLLWGTNWDFILQKTAFFIVTVVKTPNITLSVVFTFCYPNPLHKNWKSVRPSVRPSVCVASCTIPQRRVSYRVTAKTEHKRKSFADSSKARMFEFFISPPHNSARSSDALIKHKHRFTFALLHERHWTQTPFVPYTRAHVSWWLDCEHDLLKHYAETWKTHGYKVALYSLIHT